MPRRKRAKRGYTLTLPFKSHHRPFAMNRSRLLASAMFGYRAIGTGITTGMCGWAGPGFAPDTATRITRIVGNNAATVGILSAATGIEMETACPTDTIVTPTIHIAASRFVGEEVVAAAAVNNAVAAAMYYVAATSWSATSTS